MRNAVGIAVFVVLGIATGVWEYAWSRSWRETWDVLGIWIVNGGIGLVYYALQRWRKRPGQLAILGVYLPLSVALLAWSDPELWFIVGINLVGLVILWCLPGGEASGTRGVPGGGLRRLPHRRSGE